MARQQERRRRTRMTLLLMLVATFLVFSNSVDLFYHTRSMLNDLHHALVLSRLVAMDDAPLVLPSFPALVVASSSPVLTTVDHHLEQINARQQLLCPHNSTETKVRGIGALWHDLCQLGFVNGSDQLLLRNQQVRLVQIGAHSGFEDNDPLASGISKYLDMLSPQNEEKHLFQWTFVEPAPPNFKSLQANIAKYAHLCNMTAINVAVLPDSTPNENMNMPFYSISDTIDPISGYDSRSGQKFPYWITQLSSFSKKPIFFNRREWTKRGLVLEDYIVETNVTTRRYSDLMRDVIVTAAEVTDNPQLTTLTSSLLMVLIDTEGFDCSIVLGISGSSPFLPRFLVFEKCGVEQLQPTIQHLHALGYQHTEHAENILAWRPWAAAN